VAGEIGSAYADIRADLSKLDKDLAKAREKVLAEVKRIEQQAVITIGTKLDAEQLRFALSRVAALTKTAQSTVTVNVDVDSGAALAQLGAVNAVADELERDDVDMHVDLHGGAAVLAQLKLLGTEAKAAAATFAKGGLFGASGLGTLAAGVSTAGLIGGGVAAVAGIAAVTAGLGSLAKQGVQSVASLEQVAIAFEGLFQSKQAAQDFIGTLEKFAAKTPFEFDQLVGSAQRFLGAYGVGFRDELIPTLTAIGDLTASLGAGPDAIARITTALLQIKGKGRVATEELNQIREAVPGFDAMNAIAKQLGITVPETMKRIEKGTLPADEALDALIQGMREFPGAAGAMERQSQTLNGRLSTLKDNFKIVLREGFGPLAQVVGTALDGAASALADGGPLNDAIASLGKTVSGAFEKIFPTILPLITEVANALTPIIAGVADILPPLISQVGPVVDILGQFIAHGLELLGPFIEQISPAIPLILDEVAEVATTLLDLAGALLPALASIIDGLAPIIDIVGDALNPVLRLLADILGALPPQIVAVVGAFALFGPIGGVIAGIASVVSLFSDNSETLETATSTVTDALVAQTKALFDNQDALFGITGAQDAAIAAENALANALINAGENGQELLLALGALRVPLKDLPDLLVNIGKNAEEGLTKAALASGKLTAEQAKQVASFINAQVKTAGLAGALSLLDKESTRVAFGFGNLSKDEAVALTTALSQIQEAAGNVDFASITTNTLKISAAQDVLAESALAAAEQSTGLTRLTTDQDEALRLYNATIENYARLTQESVDADKEKADAQDAITLRLKENQAETEKNGQTLQAYLKLQGQIKVALSKIITPAERLQNELAGVRQEFDNLTNTKLDFSQAKAEVEELLDSFGTGEGDKKFSGEGFFDVTVQKGRDNLALLTDSLLSFRDEAVASFGVDGDAYKAGVTYALRIEDLRNKFVEAGGTVESFDAQARLLGLDPITFNLALQGGSKEALLAEIDSIRATVPTIAADIEVLVNTGNLETARLALEALKVDPSTNGRARVADIVANADKTGIDEANAALQDIIDKDRTADIVPDVNNTAAAQTESELDRLSRNRTVNIIPIVRNSGGSFVVGGTHVFISEMGGIASDIASTASHYAPGNAPLWMYGEPSTHGEYFISMHPQHRSRNEALLQDAAEKMGMQVSGGRMGGVDMTPFVERLSRLEDALMSLPPITVISNTDDPDAMGSRVYWAHRERVSLVPR